MSKRQPPHQDEKLSAQGHLWVFNEQQGNSPTTGQATAGPKTALYTGRMKQLPLYTPTT